MKKIVAAVAIAMVLATPASAATTMKWDFSKAQSSINKAATEIVSKPDFSWDSWLARILEGWK